MPIITQNTDLSALGLIGGGGRFVSKSSNYTASAGDRIVADSSGGAFIIKMPASPSDGDVVTVMPATGTFGSAGVSINGNGNTVNGNAGNYDLNGYGGSLFVYTTTNGWRRFAFLGAAGPTDSTNAGKVVFDPIYGTVSHSNFTMNAFAAGATLVMDGSGNAGFSSPSYNSGSINVTSLAGQKIKFSADGPLELVDVASGGTVSGGGRLYAKSGEVYVLDSSGNETLISPHSTKGPDFLYDSLLDAVGESRNIYTGITVWTNRTRADAGLSKSMYRETDEERNARTGESLKKVDWDTKEAKLVTDSQAAHEAWAQRKASWEDNQTPFPEEEPNIHVAEPVPDWLTAQLAAIPAMLAVQALVFDPNLKVWSSLEFLQLFTQEERHNIYARADTDPNVKDLLMMLTSAGNIYSNNPDTIQGMQYLVSVGLITETRMQEILAS